MDIDASLQIPSFEPTLLATHGLAEQLLHFDPVQFCLLDQRLSETCISFAVDPQPLAAQLRKCADRPVALKICHGSAATRVELHRPFREPRPSHRKAKSHTNTKTKTKEKIAPLNAKEIKLIAGPVQSACIFDDDSDDDEDDYVTDGGGDQRPSMLLHLPSSGYWSFDAVVHRTESWQVVSSQLPPTFLWLLNVVAESIEEDPMDVYNGACVIESQLLPKNAKLLHTLAERKEMRQRLLVALRHPMNPDVPSFAQHPNVPPTANNTNC